MHDGLSPRTLTLTQFEQAKIAQLSALRTSLCQRLDAIEMNHDAIEIGGGGGTMETLEEALSPPQPLPQPPRAQPTAQPTALPAAQPTAQPTAQPRAQPTAQPRAQPTAQPTAQPAAQPTAQPAAQSAAQPTAQPAAQSAAQPTALPPQPLPPRPPSGSPAVNSREAAELEQRIVRLLAIKTEERDDLASAVEEAAESGISAEDPRLRNAQRTLAQRRVEVDKMAAVAERLGLLTHGRGEEKRGGKRDGRRGGKGEREEEEEEELTEIEIESEIESEVDTEMDSEMPPQPQPQPAEYNGDRLLAAHANVLRLEGELKSGMRELRDVEQNSSRSIKSHPAFREMCGGVKAELGKLEAQLEVAREVYETELRAATTASSPDSGSPPMAHEAEHAARVEAQIEERAAERRGVKGSPHRPPPDAQVDLLPMFCASIDELWTRPYECRLQSLKLITALCELDNTSLSAVCKHFSDSLIEGSPGVL